MTHLRLRTPMRLWPLIPSFKPSNERDGSKEEMKRLFCIFSSLLFLWSFLLMIFVYYYRWSDLKILTVIHTTLLIPYYFHTTPLIPCYSCENIYSSNISSLGSYFGFQRNTIPRFTMMKTIWQFRITMSLYFSKYLFL